MNNPRNILVLALVAPLLGACSLIPEREVVVWDPTPPIEVIEQPRTAGAIVALGRPVNLFADLKARQVGDILTIELVEKTTARKSASTQTSKGTNIDNQNPTLFGVPLSVGGNPVLQQQVDGNHAFAGEGSSAQSNELEGAITVTVAARYPNGNLFVRGEKWLTLNQGRELVRISGIVRPYDIGPDNSVPSYKVADARIIYSGRGALADANRMGWLARLFNKPVMPY